MTPDLIERARSNDPACIPELLDLLMQAALTIMQLESRDKKEIAEQRKTIERWAWERKGLGRDWVGSDMLKLLPRADRRPVARRIPGVEVSLRA